ncbi:MAG TPA: hypothetical protein VMS31_21925 [Pyrinomonadaceae bacterium]|nr:hypothetical protein [Pyrinomonadaceae bacterium]
MLNDDSRAMRELLSSISFESIQQTLEFVGTNLKIIEINDLKTATFEMLRAHVCYTKSIKEGQPLFRAMKHNAGEGCLVV